MSNAIHLAHRVLIPLTPAKVFDYLIHMEAYPYWWEHVFPQVKMLSTAPAGTPGYRVRAVMTGFLPYPMHLEHHFLDAEPGRYFQWEFNGNLKGNGEWTLDKVEEGTLATLQLHVDGKSHLLSKAAYIIRPLLNYHHKYCVEACERGIKKEEIRRLNRLSMSHLPFF